MMRRVLLGAALYAAFVMVLSAQTAFANAGEPSGQRRVCRLAAAAPPLRLLHSTVLAENGASSPSERISRRVIYTPLPTATTAREPFLALLDRSAKPASLIVGVGY